MGPNGDSFFVLDGVPHAAPFTSRLILKDQSTMYGLGGHRVSGVWHVMRVELRIDP